VVGIDADAAMLAAARTYLDPQRTTLLQQRLEAPLPAGSFDLVVSMLAVHHLDAGEKADLFRRVREVLAPGGCFVLGDLVVPVDPAHVVTDIDGVIDVPDTLADQLTWCEAAGLSLAAPGPRRDLGHGRRRACARVAGRGPAEPALTRKLTALLIRARCSRGYALDARA
jgi:tRNA (cmo5U34)-methyltransferase